MDAGFTIWFTGLPCSGKTTIAKELEIRLKKKGYLIVHLDGDDIRKKLNEDLGFTEGDRSENLRRVGHVIQLFNEKGINVLASFVSPTDKHRDIIRDVIKKIKIIYVKCSLKECERRDIKGMYKKARMGEIKEFTGISSPFEEPKNPDFIINTEIENLEESIEKILGNLEKLM